MSLRTRLIVLVVFVVALVVPGSAFGADYIYYGGTSGPSSGFFGRANMDGTGSNPSFITTSKGTGGIALASTGLYFAWPSTPGYIGFVKTDGTGLNEQWLNQNATGNTPAVAANSRYVFSVAAGGTNYLQRTNLDGTGANLTWLTLSTSAGTYLAADENYVYWRVDSSTIGRVGVDGTGSNAAFMTGLTGLQAIAVTATHLYWSTSSGTIGRASLDGTSPNASFITGLPSSGGGVRAIAVNATTIYWGVDGTSSSSIGSANLDGSGVNQSFITGLPDGLWGLVVGSAVPATSSYALTVSKSGTGSGTITSSPTGVDCGATCSASFASGTSVTLTAAAAAGSTFVGWGGACSGASTCTVSMTEAKTVTANFKPTPIVAKSATAKATNGTIQTRITVPGPGKIVQSGVRVNRYENVRVTASAPVCSSSTTVKKAGTVTVTCTPNAATKALLRHGAVRVYLTYTFTATGGTPVKTTKSVLLPKIKSAKPATPVAG